MTSAKLMKHLDPGLSAMRSRPQLISLLRLVNRRKACVGVLPLGLKSVLKEERADHIVMGVELMPSGSPELVSSADSMDFREQQPIQNPIRYWRGIIVGCAVFLLLAGAMAVQFRASIPVPGSEPRARASVQPGSNTPSSPSPNSILRLQDGAEALRNSILAPADPSSSAIPTIIQPPKDKSRLPGLPQIAQQPGTLATIIDFAQILRDRPGLLATAYSWLAEQDRVDRTSIASLASDSEPSGTTAILYEEGLEDTQEKRFYGSVDWRTEWSARPGRELEFAVIGEITIPERNVHAIWSLRRNTRAEGPARYAIEIKFEVPSEYPLGQIVSVPGVLAKQLQQAVGDRLEGKPVKVSNGFRIDLSPLGTEAERNVRLLKERPSFEIPIAYASGRRGLLAIEKGALGDQAFSEFFRAAATSLDSN